MTGPPAPLGDRRRVPTSPGRAPAEIKARLGREDMVRLNWNENLFGPLPGVLEETAAALGARGPTPRRPTSEFRHAVAGWAGADPARGDPRPRDPGADAGARSAPSSSRATPSSSRAHLRPLRPGCAAAGADVRRVRQRRRAGAGPRGDGARPPPSTGPSSSGSAIPTTRPGCGWSAPTWAEFLDALPDGCVVVVDEAYGDYVEPDRAHRSARRHPGRPPGDRDAHVLQDLRAGRAAARLLLADRALAAHLNAVQEPFNVNRAALAAGLASLRRADQLPARREQVQRRPAGG